LKLLPDYTIVFSGKGQLKKTVRLIPVAPALYRYAAALALLLATWYYFRNVPQEGQVAVILEKPVNKSSGTAMNTRPVPGRTDIPVARTGRKPIQHVPVKGPVRGKEEFYPVRQAPLQAMTAVPPQQALTPPQQIQPQQFVTPVEPVASASPYTHEQLLEIFSAEDLKEMGLAGADAKKTTVWDLVEKGAAGVGKVTGTDVSMSRQPDESGRTKSYQFAIGNFSISHSRAGE
jgi:hypothetical protein